MGVTMGRKERGPNNNAIDVPWDHYTFNLGGQTDLQPQLRRKVEIIETEVGFCMLYPKQQRGKRHHKAGAIARGETTYAEGREPNATLQRDATFDSSEDSISPVWQNRRLMRHPASPKEQKKGSSKNLNRILDYEENNRQLLRLSYSPRSFP
mmetsp:Transcript_8376/g.17368  ORF Transcript_8376/g.17368 Transcript_8376/m.17368 type:complete len:152 (+) Transcript_8376:105-560(+)